MNHPPNILWFFTNQQCWSNIYSLGNDLNSTPNLECVVSEGVTFHNAYCQIPICTANRASFLIGKYHTTHHIHRNGSEIFPEHETLVTKILTDGACECGLLWN
jgi:arylsulfatase A-like enzyme